MTYWEFLISSEFRIPEKTICFFSSTLKYSELILKWRVADSQLQFLQIPNP